MPTTDSPLRYPGGKSQLAPLVRDVLHVNDLAGGLYVEPFAGGAGIACRLLLAGHVGEVWINDIDRSIHALWFAILNRPDELCERIARTPVTMRQWYRQRAVQARQDAEILDLAFSTLFLNRTNRSGILSGGVIGGKDQSGQYLLDCRFKKDELTAKIQRIAKYRDVITLTRLDAARLLESRVARMPARTLINIDPPYYVRGRELYTNFYLHRDHEHLSAVIRRLPRRWMLTYDDAPEIRSLYAGLPIFGKKLIYYAQVKRAATELLVLDPRLASPPGLTAAPSALAA